MTGKATTQLGLMTQGGGHKKRPALRTGRNSKLTPEISKKICDAVRAGNFVSVAARYAGVGPDTVLDWISRGRGTNPTRIARKEHIAFVHDLDAAEAAAEVQANLHWRAAMPKDWKASQRWLEVRYPERYVPQQPGSGPSGAFAGVNVNIGLTSAQIAKSEGNYTEIPDDTPLSALLEANPGLIAATMQVLDQFLPIADEVTQSDEEGVTEGEFAEIGDTEAQVEPPNDHLRPSAAETDEYE